MLRFMEGQTEFLDYHEETRLEEMVTADCPEDHRFFEGWILMVSGEMIAMSIDREGNACVVSNRRGRHFVGLPDASPFERLCYVVGKHYAVDR